MSIKWLLPGGSSAQVKQPQQQGGAFIRGLELLQSILDEDTSSALSLLLDGESLGILQRAVQHFADRIAAAEGKDWEASGETASVLAPTDAGAAHAINCLNVSPPMLAECCLLRKKVIVGTHR